jgi:Glycine rich protein
MTTSSRRLRRSRLAVLGTAALAGAALPASGFLAASPASAASTCSLTASTVTCTFTVGSNTQWTVPAGLTSLTVTADGAAGGTGDWGSLYGSIFAGAGGAGGEYKATLSGSGLSGTTLSIFPGTEGSGATAGSNAGGGGGAGSGTSAQGISGGGGGASTVAISPFSSTHMLVVAGGGGGGGEEYAGGAGGTSSSVNGATGQLTAGGGVGATSTTGGAAGPTFPGCTAATAGTPLQGGAGSPDNYTTPFCFGGSGGGGGWFGGGGSSDFHDGGGGGSAYPAATFTLNQITVTPLADTSTNTGNGSVTISYSQVHTALRNVIAVKEPGNSLLASATLTANGDPVAGQTVYFSTNGMPICSGVTNSSGDVHCLDVNASSILRNNQDKIVSASFAGNMTYYPSQGLGQIIRNI